MTRVSYNPKQGLLGVGEIIKKYQKGNYKHGLPLEFSRDKYISKEFQKYGYDLAEELGDLKNKSLYIKLAKDTPRIYLEEARNFIKDAYNVNSKARLFMWKLKELKTHKSKSGIQNDK